MCVCREREVQTSTVVDRSDGYGTFEDGDFVPTLRPAYIYLYIYVYVYIYMCVYTHTRICVYVYYVYVVWEGG